MSIRDRMYELTTPEEVDAFLSRFPTNAIFKAGGCHKTMQGFGNVEKALDGYKDLHLGFIRVIESRPASNHVAELTQIIHQSPQLILSIDGKPVYDVDNWDITPEALESAMLAHLGTPASIEQASETNSSGDVSAYVEILEAYVSGRLDADSFAGLWLSYFQSDASPRSKEEFSLLDGLFGDVDAAIEQGLGVSMDNSKLALATGPTVTKERAQELLTLLTQ